MAWRANFLWSAPRTYPAQDVEIAMASDCRSQVLGTTCLNKSHCRRGSQAMRDVATLTNPAQHYFDFFVQALDEENGLPHELSWNAASPGLPGNLNF
jgi:hypothetical protein